MAPLVGQKYKLLARYGNNVQEVWTINVKCLIESQAENCVLSFLHSMDWTLVQVMVETSLDKEQLKEAVLACTNRVSWWSASPCCSIFPSFSLRSRWLYRIVVAVQFCILVACFWVVYTWFSSFSSWKYQVICSPSSTL